MRGSPFWGSNANIKDYGGEKRLWEHLIAGNDFVHHAETSYTEESKALECNEIDS